MKQIILKRPLPFFLLFFLLVVSSCNSVRLISDYDEITDKTVTALQEKTARFFVNLEDDIGTEKAAYENYREFYKEAKVDLYVLKTRADAIDKNQIVRDQVSLLTSMVTDMEKLHKIGFSSLEQVKALEQPFNSAFTAILKLQMGLKRGK